MAENKKSFLLYCDTIHTVELLTNEQAGILFKHLLAYVNDQNPELSDPLLKIAFEPIKQALKRDLKKWESELQTKSEAGVMGNLKRWHPDIYKSVSDGTLSLSDGLGLVQSQKVASIAVSVIDSVSVSDSDIKEDKVDFAIFWDRYPKKVSKAKVKPKWDKLPLKTQQTILEHLEWWVLYKPFPEYNHPHPETYFNSKRWEDEKPVFLTEQKGASLK